LGCHRTGKLREAVIVDGRPGRYEGAITKSEATIAAGESASRRRMRAEFGRGYRRARFVFDTTEGTPKIIYRQSLSHLGWALGLETRQIWLATATP
jgi:hypothetical protein